MKINPKSRKAVNDTIIVLEENRGAYVAHLGEGLLSMTLLSAKPKRRCAHASTKLLNVKEP